MRTDSSKIGLRVIRSIRDAAQPFTLEVAGKTVNGSVTRLAQEAWPGALLEGLNEATVSPWPSRVDVRCEWEGGSAGFRVACGFVTTHKYRHIPSIRITIAERAFKVI